MSEENNSFIGFGCFFFFIVVLVLIGSIILFNIEKSKKIDGNSNKVKDNLNDKKKKDKKQDFIFYTLEENVSDYLNATIKKANINLKSEDADNINLELDKIYSNALKEIKKSNEELICENGSDIYSYNNIDYASFTYEKYITLLVGENFYSCNNELEIPRVIHAYTFDYLTGKLVSFEELLANYNLTYTKVLESLKKYLDEEQTMLEDIPNIKIDETLNELKENENYVIYISENNKLVLKYIVKTNSVNYNDVIELN